MKQAANKVPDENESDYESLYEEMKHIFHPYDSAYLSVLEKGYDFEVDRKDWIKAYEIGKSVRIAYEKYFSRLNNSRYMQLLSIGKLAHYLGKKNIC